MSIKKYRRSIKYNSILIKFLAIICIIFIVLLLFRFQKQLIIVDNYLTLGLGWIKDILYIFLITFLLLFILNYRVITFATAVIFTLTILFFCYSLANFLELVNNKFSSILNCVSLADFKIQWHQYLNNFHVFLKTENRINFYTLPWWDCNAGIAGLILTWLTNAIMVLLTTVCNFFGMIMLLSYYLYKNPVILLRKMVLLITKLLCCWYVVKFFRAKILKTRFAINIYLAQRASKKINVNFNKGAINLEQTDQKILWFFKKHKAVKFNEVFKSADFYRHRWNWYHKKKTKYQGIYAFYVEDFYGKEKILLPCYIGKSNDIIARWRSHCHEIEQAFNNPHDLAKNLAVYQRIAAYLHINNLNPSQLRFIVLQWVSASKNLAKAEEYWINKIATTQRGWNSIRAS